MRNDPIGFFDSGFGGLSIYKNVMEVLPKESTIYIGDHARLPYGGKTKQEIRERAKQLIHFLLSKHVKLIVVACNTATIAGIDDYRKWFPDIPIIGVVPVVKTGAQLTKKNSFAVLSTAFTAKSTYQKNLIKKFAPGVHVYNLGCPNLLSYVERGILEGKHIDSELRQILTPKIISNVDIVVLGCTHYPFLRDSIRAIVGKKMTILDSGGAITRHVQRILSHNAILGDKKPTHEFYSTSDDSVHARAAEILLKKKVQIQYADI